MGLMETLTGLFKSSGGQDSFVKSITGMIQDGSISMDKFKAQADKAGIADIFDSWVGSGENKPITADQVKAAANPENLERLAKEAGVTVDEAAEKLSKTLPDVVDKLSPDGVLPSDSAIQAQITK